MTELDKTPLPAVEPHLGDTPVTTTARATARRLQYEADRSAPYTKAVESYRNFIQACEREHDRMITIGDQLQAGAAQMWIRSVEVGVPLPDGTHGTRIKVVTANTAPAMSAQQMRDYFRYIGESGNETWSTSSRDGSFGQGLRQVALPQNHAGFVIIAVEPGDGDLLQRSHLMWIRFDEAQEAYVTRQLPAELVEDDAGSVRYVYDDVVPCYEIDGIDFPSLIPREVLKWGGMVFAELGMHLEDDVRDYFTDETAQNVETAITERLYDPSRLTVELVASSRRGREETRSHSSAGGRFVRAADGTEYRIDSRRLRSHDAWFAMDGVQEQSVQLADGTTIRFGLAPSNGGDARHMPFGGKGFSEVRYRGDAHKLWHSRKHVATCRELGIGHAEVARRVAVVIEPPIARDGSEPFAVEQDRTRSHLMISGTSQFLADSGKPREWADEIVDGHLLPQFIRDELAAATARSQQPQGWQERVAQIYTGLRALLAGSGLVARANGTEPGVPATPGPGTTTATPAGPGAGRGTGGGSGPGSPGDQAAPGTPLTPDPAGPVLGLPVRRQATPQVVWLSREEFTGEIGEDARGGEIPAFWDNQNRKLVFNREHPHFANEVRHLTGTWARQDEQARIREHIEPAMITSALEVEYTTLTLAAILQTTSQVPTRAQQEQLLSPDTLWVLVRGGVATRARIQEAIRQDAEQHRRGRWAAASDREALPA
ncbi:hypothetical protein [Kineococcus indalonis]|uniref:hypothetical protein n=1 Tax=Kineococcus indalonis TaxID=2696566 RepID=UPI0014130934|nr:hypothetical protein [Kineococcus indalonis]NAZ85229.1 hypothetical protein [Kineococcus indalonis]